MVRIKDSELILYGGVAVASIILLSRGKVGSYLGESAARTVTGAASGSVVGAVKGLLVDPYEWASHYEGYIPIIDDAAKAAVWFKGLGNPNSWWY